MTYTIFKNWHYAFPFVFSMWRNKIEWSWACKFSKECWNDTDDNHTNKLCGLVFGVNNHYNSARIAWKSNPTNKEEIMLYGYIYDPSFQKHKLQYLTTVQVEKEFVVKIIQHKDKYEFICGRDKVCMDNDTEDKNWGFYARPYYGGNPSSPHKMKINVKLIWTL